MTVCLHRNGPILSLVVEEPVGRDDPGQYIALLDEIAEMGEPFVLLVAFRAHLDLPHDHRKAQNLWFKATRARMNTHCRAVAIVRRDPSEEMQRTFSGLWEFPVLVTDSPERANAFLAARLPEESAP